MNDYKDIELTEGGDELRHRLYPTHAETSMLKHKWIHFLDAQTPSTVSKSLFETLKTLWVRSVAVNVKLVFSVTC